MLLATAALGRARFLYCRSPKTLQSPLPAHCCRWYGGWRKSAIHPSRALTHSKATRQKAFGVYIFDCHRLGQADVSGFRLPQPKLQRRNNSLGLASRGAFCLCAIHVNAMSTFDESFNKYSIPPDAIQATDPAQSLMYFAHFGGVSRFKPVQTNESCALHFFNVHKYSSVIK
jgi:hypothetical protein